jgi:hypothetical protein
MPKTPIHTVRYCAKQAYQLAMMTGKYESTIAGHFCQVYPSDGLRYVRVHGVEKADGDFHIVNFPIAKGWINL